MWDSNGDISGKSIQKVDPGDMRVSGNIDSHSFVYLVSTGGSITVDGKIDDHSQVILVSTTGSITVKGKVDNHGQVTLKASGSVMIGTEGGDGDKKIYNGSSVNVVAGGDIVLGGKIDGGSSVDFRSHGAISGAKIDGGSIVRELADNNISITDKIDGTSRVELVSNRGSVLINGKIDGESKVSLTANQDVAIGFDSQLGDDDRKIDGNCLVTAIAGRVISVGSGIYKDHTTVDFAAANGIAIGKDISGGPAVRLLSARGNIDVAGGISDSGTRVTYTPAGALVANNNGAQVTQGDWAVPDMLSLATVQPGYWWENYPQTFGYVSPSRVVPRSVDDIATAIAQLDGPIPVRAVGGGFSFSDVALPFQRQQELDGASTQLRGQWQQQDVRHILEGLNDIRTEPMDLLPQAVDRNLDFSTSYDSTQLQQVTFSGSQLPGIPRNTACLIDTRSLASSLQDQFRDIRLHAGGNPPFLFHVEAGITMADLQQLLDHQQPRLALRAPSAGPSGATLAGILSTSTHGAEFTEQLPADSVRAVHLVGPGGEQWWIEGDVRVANPKKLQARYPKIDKDHFIANGWTRIPGLTAQDVLNAVRVSMGTMGVIYSVVLEVKPQYGVRQVVRPTTWMELLNRIQVPVEALRGGDVAANQRVLDALMDGRLNGTGIEKAKNVFAHMRINPFSFLNPVPSPPNFAPLDFDCWVINQEVTPNVPVDANTPPIDYLTELSRALACRAEDTGIFGQDPMAVPARIFDFLSWAKDIVDVGNDLSQGGRLLSFITGQDDLFGGTLATLGVQAVANVRNSNHSDRGQPFLKDLVTGVFHALHGTGPGQNSENTAVPYKFGAIGWPARGTPGRALEIAMDPTNAFTFVQKVLFDLVLQSMAEGGSPLTPLIGYIAIRVCQTTKTLLGMQQYSPFSVMVEVAGYRSPEANQIMDSIQSLALTFETAGPKPLLHWGLENDQVTGAYLTGTPLGQPYKAGLTRVEAFTAIRNYLKKGHPPVFDNNFSARLGL